jgi:TolB-like protein/Flp pilus assembly protein TadD
VPVQPVERKLAAIFAADIAGYSRLMARDEIGTLARLKASRVIIDGLIASHRGRIFNTAGDSVVADFASAVEAVQCAVAVQAAITTENADGTADEPMQFRIGVHVGDVMVDGDNLLGDGVNIAARLESLAEPGAICISAAARDHVGNKLPLAFDDLGDQQVKNIAQPIRVYRVQAETPAAQPVAALPLPDKPSIAVLPFQNMSGDPEQEYFADGMVEEIITALSKIRWFFVIARNSTFTYKGRAVDVKEVGRELGVRYVLEGSVRKAGNRVRITGQLIDTATGAHIWADRFDAALDDIFVLQDQVASTVAGAIEPKLRQSEIDRSSRKPTASLDVYDLYLRARAQLLKYAPQNRQDAIELARQALAIDPAYAPAAGLLALCCAYQQAGGLISDDAIAEGLRCARQSVELGKDDSDALAMGGHALWALGRDEGAGRNAIERALALNQNSALAWSSLALLHAQSNRPSAAIESAERALRLSPLDPQRWLFYTSLGIAHLIADRAEEAATWVDLALYEQLSSARLMELKAVICVRLGRIDEARAWVKRLREFRAGWSIERYKKFIGQRQSPEVLAIIVDGLRAAGLPEG